MLRRNARIGSTAGGVLTSDVGGAGRIGAGDEREPKVTLLELRGIEKRFGEFHAVRDLSLKVGEGEFVTLLGQSGSGKTTTLLIVAGFIEPTNGTVSVRGHPITRLPAHKRNMGVVFQDYLLFPHLTVFDNIAFPLRRRGMGKREISIHVRESLDLVRLAGVEDRYARELSGGQKQRVALARATVYRPQLLLMDEPLSALDKKLRDEMQLELRRIHQDLGTSVLYVTHDQGEALALSSRVVLMRDGMIEQEGSPSDVYQNPKTVFAASFLGEANQLRGRVVRRQEGATAVVELSNGRLVLGRTEMGPEAPPDVVVVVRPEDVELVDAADAGALRVELADAVYMGNRIRYSGTFETGEPAVLSLDRGRAGLLAMTGEAYVRWNAPDATVIPVRQGDEPAPASESEHPGLLGRE